MQSGSTSRTASLTLPNDAQKGALLLRIFTVVRPMSHAQYEVVGHYRKKQDAKDVKNAHPGTKVILGPDHWRVSGLIPGYDIPA